MTKKPNKADKLIYNTLQKAIEQDKLRLYLDYAKVNRPGSKIYNPWEYLLPVLVPIILGLLLIVAVNVLFGLLFIVSMIIVCSHYFRKKFYHRIIDRAKAQIKESYNSMEDLWEYGGIVFVNSDNKKLGCVSPEGDWKDFVVLNYSNLMTDKKPEPEEEKKDEKPARTSARRKR